MLANLDEIDEQKECWFLVYIYMRDENKDVPGGRRETTYDHGMFRRLLRVTPPVNELSWKVETMTKQKQKGRVFRSRHDLLFSTDMAEQTRASCRRKLPSATVVATAVRSDKQ